MENTQQEPTITFNGKTYIAKNLPQDVQEIIQMHQEWTGTLAIARREVLKNEVAIRGLLVELDTRFKTIDELAAEAASVPTPATEKRKKTARK